MSKREETEREIAGCAVYWFTLMELGRGHGDFMQAARAKAELERLGVWVSYRPLVEPDRWARRAREKSDRP